MADITNQTDDTTRPRRPNKWQVLQAIGTILIAIILATFGWIGGQIDKERRADEVARQNALAKIEENRAASEKKSRDAIMELTSNADRRLKRIEKALGIEEEKGK